jgi:hypothetical protein
MWAAFEVENHRSGVATRDPGSIMATGLGEGSRALSVRRGGEAKVGRSSDYLSVAQFDLLSWVSRGCGDGVYEGTSYRTSARALHNRGLIQIAGSGRTWTAKITPEGTRLLKEQTRRVEAEREREHREEQARTEREREQQRLRARAVEVLEAVTAAGGADTVPPTWLTPCG